MICERTVEKYCKDYTKIENYEIAIADETQTWDCHHRKEIEGNTKRSAKELIDAGLYFNRPSDELIFLTKSEHRRLHNKGNIYMKGKTLSEKTKQKISEVNIGSRHPLWRGRVQCIETNKVYECASIAEKELGIRNVGKVCCGIRKTAGGYHWRYYD